MLAVAVMIVSGEATVVGTPSAAAGGCVEVATTADAAEAIARRCAREVVVGPATSEVSRLVARPDGVMVWEQHAGVVRVRRGSGWVAVDPSLSVRPDGSFAPRATAVGLRLSGGGSGPLVRMTVGSGSVSLSWPRPLPVPVIEADTAVYREVLAGVDLRVRATDAGFTQVLEVKHAAAAADPALRQIRYRLSTSGLAVRDTADGGLEIVGSGGEVVASAPQGLMWDSGAGEPPAAPSVDRTPPGGGPGRSTSESPGDMARTAGVTAELDRGMLLVTPDPRLLAAPEAVFPIYIDPVFNSTRRKWAYARDTNQNNNDGVARAGRSPDGTGTYRSFFEFELGPTVSHRPIVDARFYTTLVHSSACTDTPVSLYHTGNIPTEVANATRTAWSPALKTWLDERWGKANKNSCPQPDLPMEFSGALKDKVQEWVDINWSITTLGLSTRRANGTGESTTSYWKKFRPADTRLVIWFNNAPDQPVPQAFASTECRTQCISPAVVRTTQPQLRVRVSDPNGDQLRADFEVRTSASDTASLVASGQTGALASGSTAAWTVPAGVLSSGAQYYWRVQAVDELSWRSQWTSWQTLSVDTIPPPTPTASSVEYPHRQWGAVTGTPGTFQLASGSSFAADFVWWVDGGPATPAPGAGTGPVTATAGWTPGTDLVHHLHAYAVDTAGNASGTGSYEFWVAPLAAKYARWRLDELSGTSAADSGAGGSSLSPGALSAGVSWAADPDPDRGRVASLAGSGQITTTGPVLDTTKSFTVMAWVSPSELAGSRTIVSQDGTSSSRFQLRYDAQANAGAGGWCFGIRPSDGAELVSACADGAIVGPPGTGQWTHVAGSYDVVAGTIQVYVMGNPDDCFPAEAASVGFTGTWSATGAFVIGRARSGGAPSEHLTGAVDDVHAYQKRLAGWEICQHAQS